ncbi:hypothetical protein [Arthrobacter sp. UYEF21]|uniref:hypothetical protein n=1 Tax=Arthrobacter sp. UYEF21 TaxID=1756364 RepID=UPI00339534E9
MTVFDPDSSDSQPQGSLEALIARTDAEVSELQFPHFTKDESLHLGLLLKCPQCWWAWARAGRLKCRPPVR